MSDLISIQSQIEKLQKQANEIKAREFDKTVAEIIAKMQAFGITVKDLEANKRRLAPAGAKGGKARGAGVGREGDGKTGPKAMTSRRRPSKNAGIPVPPKYRGPHGETWSGRGLMPRWLATLVAQGQSKDSFAIPAEASDPSSTSASAAS